MKNIPEKIYLNIGEYSDEEFQEVAYQKLDELELGQITWSDFLMNRHDIEYTLSTATVSKLEFYKKLRVKLQLIKDRKLALEDYSLQVDKKIKQLKDLEMKKNSVPKMDNPPPPPRRNKVKYSLIAAMTKDRVIGKDNSIPWNLPVDMKLFKSITLNGIVIMGRKTWESIPEKFRPLPSRINIIVSSTLDEKKKSFLMGPNYGTAIVGSIQDAFNVAKEFTKSPFHKKIFVIGGASIYQQTIKDASELHLSFVKEDHQGDTYFPKYSIEDWESKGVVGYQDFTYQHLVRK